MPDTGKWTFAVLLAAGLCMPAAGQPIGQEVAIARHLYDGEEFLLPPYELVAYGRQLFEARWTADEGGGRPSTTGTGVALADPGRPLLFPNNFNRVSGPDANSCAGCHNQPRSGGAGDHVANVFVLGQRFDFATFDEGDFVVRRGSRDERGSSVNLNTIANDRNTVSLFGAGYIEMLARQITAELQAMRDRLGPNDSVDLRASSIDFGTLRRAPDGRWDTSGITSLPPSSLSSKGAADPPSLIVRPFHQVGAVVSLREFSNNAFNHHHGMQSMERFGPGDPDNDGYTIELTRADLTAVSLYQATLAVPGRIIPRDPRIEAAVATGEQVFADIGCADCHIPSLGLDQQRRYFSEPGPYNPEGNLRSGESADLAVDLNDPAFDRPRLRRKGSQVPVPAYTDFRLHDITDGANDPNCEPLDMHFAAGSDEFFSGNCRFLTSRLWGVASTAPYFHHGKYTTLREAIEAHRGDADYSRSNWTSVSDYRKNAVIEFLKTLRILPEGTSSRIVDEHLRPRRWGEKTGIDRRFSEQGILQKRLETETGGLLLVP